MRIVKRVSIWIMISLIIQLAGLYYVNTYFLSSNTSIKTKKIVKSEPNKPDVEVKIPDNAKDITVSFDARYVAYYDGDVLKVVNTRTGEEKNVEFNNGVQVSFYKWLPDRNRMLIAEKESSKQASKFKLAYYDVDKDLKEDIKSLDWSTKNAEVEDIQASPLTNVIYVKIASGGKRSSIYWINIMKEMKKVDTSAYMIGNIRIIPHEDKLVYEDITYNKIYITGEDQPLTINGVSNPSLLGVDDNDNVYIGETQQNKVTKICFGSIKDGSGSFQNLNLSTPVDKKDIFINSQGNIYINDNLKGAVREFKSGKEYVYHGTFTQVYDGGVASISDGKLRKTVFN